MTYPCNDFSVWQNATPRRLVSPFDTDRWGTGGTNDSRSSSWRSRAGGAAFNTVHKDTEPCLSLRGIQFASEPTFPVAKGLCGGSGGGSAASPRVARIFDLPIVSNRLREVSAYQLRRNLTSLPVICFTSAHRSARIGWRLHATAEGIADPPRKGGGPYQKGGPYDEGTRRQL
jgi:hypothetical protein